MPDGNILLSVKAKKDYGDHYQKGLIYRLTSIKNIYNGVWKTIVVSK